MMDIRWSKLFCVIAVFSVMATPCLYAGAAPRFMLLIDEKNMGTYSMGDVERVLTDALIHDGAEVVDAELG